MSKKKVEEKPQEKSSGGSMHYPAYHVSNKQLKLYAMNAKTPEARRGFTSQIKHRHAHGR